MKIVVTANGANLDAQASPVFGRCPAYVFVDTETMQFEAVQNPAVSASGGAGIQAAQFVVERGGQAVVTGHVGPNAYNVFLAANVPVHMFGGGSVRQAVETYKAGQLPVVGGPNVPAHAGMGAGRGMGMGQGRGMGAGTGRGRRMGMAVPGAQPVSEVAPAREEEVAALKEMAGDLRSQLAEVMERLDRLEKGG